jgi:hypothetical protein
MSVPEIADDFASQEVIRPAAVLSENNARLILQGLSRDDVLAGGLWWTRVGTWRRYASPWSSGTQEPGEAVHIGTISSVYDSPTRYAVTVFRVSMTAYGLRQGWTTTSLCDEAFAHAGLTLADCPRANLHPAPRPFSELRRDTGQPR